MYWFVVPTLIASCLHIDRDLEYWDAEDRKAHGEARRKAFWELVTLEGWMVLPTFSLSGLLSDPFQSLGLGRPATIHFSQFDCKMPAATRRAMMDASSGCASESCLLHFSAHIATVHEWHTWKHVHARSVSDVLQKALDAETPPYSDIIELDRTIHAFTMPPDVEALANGLPYSSTQPESTTIIMQRWLLLQARDTGTLRLHIVVARFPTYHLHPSCAIVASWFLCSSPR